MRRRDLRDEVTVQGTLGRVEQRTINAATNSDVSRVYSKDGATLATGESVLALDGRDSVTADGDVPVLPQARRRRAGQRRAAARADPRRRPGFSPGRVDTVYTTQTRFALAQWQAAHDYPGRRPADQQTVNVVAPAGLGLQARRRRPSAGATIGPPAPARAAALGVSADPLAACRELVRRPIEAPSDRGTRFRSAVHVRRRCRADADDPGGLARSRPRARAAVLRRRRPTRRRIRSLQFTVSLGVPPAQTTSSTPSGPFTLGTDAASTTIQIQTMQNNLVEPDKTLVVSLDGAADYDGRPPGVGDHDDPVADACRELTHHRLRRRSRPARAPTLTINADQAPIDDIPVTLNVERQRGRRHRLLVVLAGGVLPGRVRRRRRRRSRRSTAPRRARQAHHRRAGAELGDAYRIGSGQRRDDHDPGDVGQRPCPGRDDPARAAARVQRGPARAVRGQPRPHAEPAAPDRRSRSAGTRSRGPTTAVPGGLLVVQPGQTSLQVSDPDPRRRHRRARQGAHRDVATARSRLRRRCARTRGAVLIQSEDLPKVTIVGGPADVSKGSAVTFTVVADQPPIEDTSVQYSVTGSAKPGQNFEPRHGHGAAPHAGQTIGDRSRCSRSTTTSCSCRPTSSPAPGRPASARSRSRRVTSRSPGKPLFSLTETGFTVTLKASAADRTKLKVGQADDGAAPGRRRRPRRASSPSSTRPPTTDETTKTSGLRGQGAGPG